MITSMKSVQDVKSEEELYMLLLEGITSTLMSSEESAAVSMLEYVTKQKKFFHIARCNMLINGVYVEVQNIVRSDAVELATVIRSGTLRSLGTLIYHVLDGVVDYDTFNEACTLSGDSGKLAQATVELFVELKG